MIPYLRDYSMFNCPRCTCSPCRCERKPVSHDLNDFGEYIHGCDPAPSRTPLIYGVWKRADLIAVYNNQGAAIAHANAIEESEHATVSVDLWKVRETFDAAGYRTARAASKLAPEDQKALGLNLADLARHTLEKSTKVYAGSTGPRASKEYLNRE